MSLTMCTIHFAARTDRTVYVSSALMKSLQLTGTKPVTLKMGSKAVSAPIKIVKKPGIHLYIPVTVKNQLLVPRSGTCMAVSNGPREIQLGPLVGILTNASTANAAQPFGSRSSLLKDYIRPGSKKSFFFAFMPSDVNWTTDTVVGYFPTESGWIRKTVPLPDVVYNRLSSRKAEKSLSIENFKERFVRRGIPLFNWSFFDKSDVYNLLDGDKEAFKHVPESHLNPTPERVREMLDKHRFVYLKPTGGSLGIGIYRLTYHPKRGYFARFRRGGKNVLYRFSQFSGLMNLLNARSGRLRNYVVQQGIRLIEIDNCPIDFRFHLHKNGQNQWVVAGIGAKKAGKGSVTTHVKNGGQIMTPEQVLDRVFGSKADAILQNSKQAAIKLAESIEKNSPHILGELGFDIGIDQDEQIWMFEANSKPGRSIFKHPSLKSQGKTSLELIFEHSMYLGRFRARREA
ncbi:YheC/YheD family protein [Paenibacillus mesophilus]|uniref:YheC/YheD family endospore coat-associated protein n=1 Tax=Paenibacillus mesophilus TaxID=2582849 RepID=UPI00110D32A8|nr:YheC/YheD family protein [Paenibacillus mesophilus]TMV47633.1 YheC/YheD family protein [Paenibacillus mesophilus]